MSQALLPSVRSYIFILSFCFAEPTDYLPVSEDLFYRGGNRREVTKTFDIIINDDSDAEDDEDFELTVTPVRNIVVLTPVIRVTILCDENDGGIPHLLYDEYF